MSKFFIVIAVVQETVSILNCKQITSLLGRYIKFLSIQEAI